MAAVLGYIYYGCWMFSDLLREALICNTSNYLSQGKPLIIQTVKETVFKN